MANLLHIGFAPTRRQLDLAVSRYREIADLARAHKEQGLIKLEGADSEFISLATLSGGRLSDLGIGEETVEAVSKHLSELDPAQEAAVLVIEWNGTGAATAGLVNLLLDEGF